MRPTSRPSPPSLIVPPASLAAVTAASTVWFNANSDLCHKFDVAVAGIYRWANLRVATQSGNIAVSIVRFAGSRSAPTYKRVATTGIIACPAAGDNEIDLGAAVLPPGRYGLSLWVDNVVAAFFHSSYAPVGTRQTAHLVYPNAAGVPASGTPAFAATSRFIAGFSLSADN